VRWRLFVQLLVLLSFCLFFICLFVCLCGAVVVMLRMRKQKWNFFGNTQQPKCFIDAFLFKKSIFLFPFFVVSCSQYANSQTQLRQYKIRKRFDSTTNNSVCISWKKMKKMFFCRFAF
jgi:hypothetical protein